MWQNSGAVSPEQSLQAVKALAHLLGLMRRNNRAAMNTAVEYILSPDQAPSALIAVLQELVYAGRSGKKGDTPCRLLAILLAYTLADSRGELFLNSKKLLRPLSRLPDELRTLLGLSDNDPLLEKQHNKHAYRPTQKVRDGLLRAGTVHGYLRRLTRAALNDMSTKKWFEERFGPPSGPKVSVPAYPARLGNAVVLNLAEAPGQRLLFNLVEDAPAGEFLSLSPGRLGQTASTEHPWLHHLQAYAQAQAKGIPANPEPTDKLRGAPTGFRAHMLDNPGTIHFRWIGFSYARYFLSCVEHYQLSPDRRFWDVVNDARPDYPLALPPAQRPPPRPGILFTPIVAITTGIDPDRPHVVFCQRQIDQMHELNWSASIGEQFDPHQDYATVKGEKQYSIDRTILRGIHEELGLVHRDLQTGGGDDIEEYRILAVLLEETYWNLGVSAVCKIRLTLEELFDKWCQAPDPHEHRQIVAAPLDDSLVKACLAVPFNQPMPKEIWERFVRADRPGAEELWLSTHNWLLHPTSRFNLAIALWATEANPDFFW